MNTTEKLTALRARYKEAGIVGYMQPVHDEYLSEYPPACFQRVAWLCGFLGSAGMAVVLQDRAALFVDGRYTLQAAAQVEKSAFSVHNSGDITPEAWIAGVVSNAAIGYDPALFTPAMVERISKTLAKNNLTLKAVPNLVDAIWKDRPSVPATPIIPHAEQVAGETAESKCTRLAAALQKEGVDAAFIAAPDSVCWLLNMRASDVECTPLALCRAILYADGKVDVLVDASRLPPLGSFVRGCTLAEALSRLAGKTLRYDEHQLPQSLVDSLTAAGAKLVKGEDPCTLPKACKNEVQLAGMRAAHVRDGAAVAKLLHWLESHPQIDSVSEMDIAEKLLAFRKEDSRFVEPSFPTIAGAGEHGAIVHYRADLQSNRKLKKGELLLLDSGGQYPDGTTDITRTIAIGTPTAEHKDRFTRVLKGHIALATARFPKGTRGSQLDALARQYLWQVGLDYDHGTGHGVGQFLGVHEGPQRISKRGGDAVLQPGMILSNEPGYYKAGEYGIRIENLVMVVEKEDGFLGFETITCAPIDTTLVEPALMNAQEIAWLNRYHDWVRTQLAPQLGEAQNIALCKSCINL